MDVITYPCWNWSNIVFVKEASGQTGEKIADDNFKHNFVDEICLISIFLFIKASPWECVSCECIIGLNNGLVPVGRQAIISINNDLVQRRIYICSPIGRCVTCDKPSLPSNKYNVTCTPIVWTSITAVYSRKLTHGSLLWRHNECDGVWNHQPNDCLLKRLFRRRSKKTSKLRVTDLCAKNSPVTG